MFIECLVFPGIEDPTEKKSEFSIKRDLWEDVAILV